MVTVLKHVGMPVFLTSLSSAQTFKIGSLVESPILGGSCLVLDPSISCSRVRVQTYGDSDEQRGAVDLAHVCDGTGLVSLESAHHLPARADDADVSISATEKEVFRPGADARYSITLEESARLVVRDLDLGSFEEVKRPPL
jgi:hypothetical protein